MSTRWQKSIVLLSSLVLFGLTNYGHSITALRINVLTNGNAVKTEVTRISSKRTNRTYFVTIDNIERDAGENLGEFKVAEVGDSIIVKYISNIKYVVPQGVEGYRGTIIFQYCMFGISVILFSLSVGAIASKDFDRFLTEKFQR